MKTKTIMIISITMIVVGISSQFIPKNVDMTKLSTIPKNNNPSVGKNSSVSSKEPESLTNIQIVNGNNNMTINSDNGNIVSIPTNTNIQIVNDNSDNVSIKTTLDNNDNQINIDQKSQGENISNKIDISSNSTKGISIKQVSDGKGSNNEITIN
jgi:hypothetical protein